MLARLLGSTDQTKFHSSVISLSGEGAVAAQIRALGVMVRNIDMRSHRAVADLYRLFRELRIEQPDIVQTWMYHGNLVGGLAATLHQRAPVVWNITNGRPDKVINKRSTMWISHAGARISRFMPDRIVCCSRASLDAHAALGYARDKMLVIPNGFDTATFFPEPRYRREVRDELGVGPDTLLVGLAARYDLAKDHATFCEAAGTVARNHSGVRFLLCGDGITPRNVDLTARLKAAGVIDRCHLLGRRTDMPRVMASLDIAVSSSVIEAFPNVVGEAMACGVPCVTTTAGDCEFILGNTGAVVPIGDAEALGAGILRLIEVGQPGRARLGGLARRRIAEQFGLANIVRQYENLYQELASQCVA
jgi:glycosyltransferase involved in cell wall biosynthesis